MSKCTPAAKRALAVVSCILMALAWLIPNHYPPWVSFYNECAMGFSLVALFALQLIEDERSPTPILAWVVAAVAVIPVLQWLSGLLIFSGDAVVTSMYLFATCLSIFVGHALAASNCKRIATLLCLATLVAGCVSSVVSLSQAAGIANFGMWAEFATPDMRAVGNLAQPNNFATLLGMSTVAVFYLYESRRVSWMAAVAVATLLVSAAALTQSRISLTFGIVVCAGIVVARRSGVPIRTPLLGIVCLTLLHWLLMWSIPAMIEVIFQLKLESLAERGVETPRYQMWKMLLHATTVNAPWSGFGWLQVGAAELSVVDQYPAIKELWLQAHNIFIELIVADGWPLGLALGLLLVYWFASRFACVKTLEALVGMLVVGIVGAHSLVELPYQYVYFLIPVGLWAGLVEFEQQRRTLLDARAMVAPAALALTLFLSIAHQYGPIEEDFRLVRFESARIGDLRASQPSPAAPLLSSLTSFLLFTRTEPKRGMSAAELTQMEDVVKRYPYAASLVRYASALAMNGRVDEARIAFVKIRYMYGEHMYRRMRTGFHERAQAVPLLQPLDNVLPLALPF